MKRSNISNNLLFSQLHFDLLANLYGVSSRQYDSEDAIYRHITQIVAQGLEIERASVWEIKSDKLLCLSLYNAETQLHTQGDALMAETLPQYYQALKDGIAIVANDAVHNVFTRELANDYLKPLQITDMLDLPIRQDGKLIGVLCCENCYEQRDWSVSNLAFARTVCDVLALQLEQYRHWKTGQEFEQLYLMAQKLNEKLLDITHIISHNIRSNTSNIAMILDLIADGDDETEKGEYFNLLKESSAKLSETIFYLNETIDIQIGSKQRKVKINIKQAIQKTLQGINGIIKKECAEINIGVPNDLELKTIPSYFESILFNLVTNAIKYRKTEVPPKIEISAVKTAGKTHITVSDNGRGIDLGKYKHKIFGMYKTFHGNKDAVGLGLFMSRNHAEALGGSIEVTSAPGQGSVFKLTL